ncbi:MAG: hypothetical protein H8E57_05995 [Candidatus Cloacimonetes bacterium]|nr:hypothetical protein [Candidatus Cloacimonadota bacterium]
MAIPKHNSIAGESFKSRGGRISNVSANIADLAAELGLTPEQVLKLAEMLTEWNQSRAVSQVERGDKDMAFEDYRLKKDDASDLYLKIKEVLNVRIENTDQGQQLAEGYGIARQSPQSYEELTSMIDTMKMKHDQLVLAGDTRVAPQSAIDDLVVKKTDLINAYNAISKERQESAKAYDDQNALYLLHSKLLRDLYSIASLVWGKHDPRLILLGFAPAKPRPGGGQPDTITGFVFESLPPVLTFTWHKPENTTSYQLVYSDDEDVWEELYDGDEETFAYQPPVGKRWYQVRARNANGFSDWSEMLVFEVPEVPE